MKKRQYSLDVLRIVATVFIVFHHYQQFTNTYFEGKLNFYGGHFNFGLLVEFFFLLSGFLLYKHVEDEQTFPDFFVPKMIRLLPLVMLSSIAYEVLLILYNRVCNRNWQIGNKGSVWGIVTNSLGIQVGWGFENLKVNQPVWYVSVLLFCYLVFHFLRYISRRLDIPNTYLFVIMIFVGAGILTYGLNLPLLNPSLARGYYSFFFGLLLAKFLKNKKIGWKSAVISWGIVFFFTIGFVFYYHYFEDGISYILTFFYYPAWMVLFLSKPVQKLFDFKILGTLGAITYSMYVWHTPMILLMFILLEVLPVRVDIHTAKAMWIFVGIMLLFGIISHYLLEKPMANLLRNMFLDKDNTK